MLNHLPLVIKTHAPPRFGVPFGRLVQKAETLQTQTITTPLISLPMAKQIISTTQMEVSCKEIQVFLVYLNEITAFSHMEVYYSL